MDPKAVPAASSPEREYERALAERLALLLVAAYRRREAGQQQAQKPSDVDAA